MAAAGRAKPAAGGVDENDRAQIDEFDRLPGAAGIHNVVGKHVDNSTLHQQLQSNL